VKLELQSCRYRYEVKRELNQTKKEQLGITWKQKHHFKPIYFQYCKHKKLF